MADYDFPPSLLEAQRAYDAADARVQEVTDALPSSMAVLSGEAEISMEQRQALADARADRLHRLAVLYHDAWWDAVEDQRAARLQLQEAAKARGAH